VDESAGRDQRRAVGLEQLLGSRWRRKHERKEKKSQRDTKRRAEQPADQENQNAAPEPPQN
jgi:hypothetical protein